MSGEDKTEEDLKPFNELKAFLIESGVLTTDDANIYVMGLLKGTITSRDITNEIPKIRQNTAGEMLQRLSRKGFFEEVPLEGGKGRARKYVAINPKFALKDLLARFNKLQQQWLELIDEHLNVLAETQRKVGQIRVISSQEVAFARCAELLKGAKQSLKIYSHDCSWMEEDTIKASIKKAAQKRIPILIYATNLNDTLRKTLTDWGTSVYRIETPGIPFCIVDDSLLIMPFKTGTLATEYNVIISDEEYIVKNYEELFLSMGRQKSGG